MRNGCLGELLLRFNESGSDSVAWCCRSGCLPRLTEQAMSNIVEMDSVPPYTFLYPLPNRALLNQPEHYVPFGGMSGVKILHADDQFVETGGGAASVDLQECKIILLGSLVT